MGSLVCLVPSEQSTRAGWQAGRTHSLEDSPTIKFMGTKADLVKTLRRGGGGGGGTQTHYHMCCSVLSRWAEGEAGVLHMRRNHN